MRSRLIALVAIFIAAPPLQSQTPGKEPRARPEGLVVSSVYGPKIEVPDPDTEQHFSNSRPFNPTDVETDGRVDVLFIYQTGSGTQAQQQEREKRIRDGAERAIGHFHLAVRNGVPGLQPALRLNLLGLVALPSVPDDIEEVENDSTIKNLREAQRADVVIVLHENPLAWNRGAWVETEGVVNKNYCRSPEQYWQHGYALVDEKQILGTSSSPFIEIYTAAHELGHIFGAGHNLDHKQPGGCMYNDSSYGHSMIMLEHGRWSHYGTLMSYLGARQPIFSNPDVVFRPEGSVADGVPAGSRHANNARAIRDSYRIISNYYPTERGGVRLRRNGGPEVQVQVSGPRRRNTVLQLSTTVRDPDGDPVAGAEVTWRGSMRLTCPKESNNTDRRPPRGPLDASADYICTREGDTFTWSIYLTSTTAATYTVRGFDVYGTYGVGQSGTVQIAP